MDSLKSSNNNLVQQKRRTVRTVSQGCDSAETTCRLVSSMKRLTVLCTKVI